MKTVQDIKKLLGRKIAPCESWHEMDKRLREQDAKDQFKRFSKQFTDHKINKSMGRCGLTGKHLQCTFDNYIVTNPDQQKALDFSRYYAENFRYLKKINYVFFGHSRTGKNHLSAAICNFLTNQGISCLVITVTELMLKIKSSYRKDSKVSEEQILKEVCAFDFLVIDEIGVHHASENTKVLLNYIIDQRSINSRHTGILSNLNASDLRRELGDRSLNRIMELGTGIKFLWDQYTFDGDEL